MVGHIGNGMAASFSLSYSHVLNKFFFFFFLIQGVTMFIALEFGNALVEGHG